MIDQDLELVVGATQTAINRAIEKANQNIITRPATVLTVSGEDGALAEVALDGDESNTPVGTQVIYPTGVIAGDRVLVMFVEPHGTFLIGRRGGDFDRWHVVNDNGNPDDPNFVAGWQHIAGAGWTNTANFAYCSFRRHGRLVELRGGASRVSGSSTAVYRLPPEYCPENNLTISAVGALGSHNIVNVAIDGLITTTSTTVVFDGITFSVNKFGDESES